MQELEDTAVASDLALPARESSNGSYISAQREVDVWPLNLLLRNCACRADQTQRLAAVSMRPVLLSHIRGP